MVTEQLIDEINDNKFTNRFHSILLILAMAALLCVVGFLTFGLFGFVISIAFTAISALWGQRVSTAWIMKMYKAREIHPQQAPAIYSAFKELAERAELKYIPKLYYIPTRMPNAFATGHKKSSAVAVTDGIIRMMNPRELNGILGHELAHLMHRDTKVMALADTMGRITSTASRIGFFMIFLSGISAILNQAFETYYLYAFAILFFSPTIMVLMQLALSRSREFNADLGAVQLTGDSIGLASALQKLERLNQRGGFWQRILRPGQKRAQPALLRTHPPSDERIKRLMEHADQSQFEPPRIPQNQGRRLVAVPMQRVRRRPKYRITSGMWH